MRVVLVYPAGNLGWNSQQGAAEGLARLGWLKKALPCGPGEVKGVFRYLRRHSDIDFVLLTSADHHLPFLHDTEEKRRFWRDYPRPCFCGCFENILDSRFAEAVPRSESALRAFSHFACIEELDEPFFAKHQRRVLWLPMWADTTKFTPGPPLAQRIPKIFFQGKAPVDYYGHARQNLLDALDAAGLLGRVGPGRCSDEELADGFRRHALALSPTGTFDGYNVRAYEAMASGCLLFQYRAAANRVRNNALFNDDEDLFLFDPNDLDGLVQRVRAVLQDLPRYQAIADHGRQKVEQLHTLDLRLRQIVEFTAAELARIPQVHAGAEGDILNGFRNLDTTVGHPLIETDDPRRLDTIPDHSLDRIYACHVLTRIPQDELLETFRRWQQKLRPAGELLVSAPGPLHSFFAGATRNPLRPRAPDSAPHASPPTRGFTAARAVQLLQDAGFTKIDRAQVQDYPFLARSGAHWRWHNHLVGRRA